MPGFFQAPVAHAEDAPTLELRDVTVLYGGLPALEKISLQVEQGDQIAVVGPNGAGKSTLFNVIAGIIKPNQGTVRVYGSGPRGHICVGYVPQRSRIDWRFPVDVTDVVMMGRVGRIGMLRRPGREDRRLVQATLEQVGMQAYAHRQIGELSGGQQQRVFLARALAQEAELLLLDEPLTGLDMPSQETILQILGELHAMNITLLIATHDLNQAAAHFPKILLLNRRVIGFGRPADVLTPARLGDAYGSQVHIVRTGGENGDEEMLITDTCCGGGHAPVSIPASTSGDQRDNGQPAQASPQTQTEPIP